MEFKTIDKQSEGIIIEKKSKFIATIVPIGSKNEAEEKIKEIKKTYSDAKHNCYAYCVLENESKVTKSSDDGEPSGTAGIPILKVITENNICNVLVVVTRYFGGILLGTGGLLRAYTDATKEALNNSNIKNMQEGYEIEVETNYPDLDFVKYQIEQAGGKIISIDYMETIKLTIDLEEILMKEIKNKNGKIGNKIQKIGKINKKYIEKS